MSRSINMHAWFVDGADMRTRSRQGGRTALNGYEYQAAHAVHFITQLLTCEGGLVQVRYEGAQDIDVMFGDGRQVYIQYKETSGREYSFEDLREILHGFMRDVIDACGHPPDLDRLATLKLEFLLVSTGVFVGTEMMRLIRGSYTKILAANLAKGFTYSEKPIKKAEHKAVAEYVLKNVSVRLSSKLQECDEPNLLATARLALFGVPAPRISASIARLKELLTPPRNTFSADAVLCLDGLPDYHPASSRSPVRIVPSETFFPAQAYVEQEFRESGRVSWPAIHFGLDAARDCTAAIHRNIIDLGKASGVVLVAGPAGSGKSTVIRRVAWEIHRAGKALVFEIPNPSVLYSQAWDEIVRLAELANRPALIVVDDISNHQNVLDELRRNSLGNVIVIASDRNARCIPTSFPVHVCAHRLDEVSSKELGNLAVQLGRRLSATQVAKLKGLMRDGEIFALSLVLRGSSLPDLAERTLTLQKQHVPELRDLFLCLCICGVYDQAIPVTLLSRIEPSAEVWNKAKAERLVFEEPNNRLRSGHAKLASTIIEQVRPDVTRLKIALLERADVSDTVERRFALGLLQNGLSRNVEELVRFADQLSAFAAALAPVGDYLDLSRCARILGTVKNAGAVELTAAEDGVKSATRADRVRTGHDAVVFMRQSSDFESSFAVVARVFASSTVQFGRNSFMRWVIERGLGQVALQREAVSLQFGWIRSKDFPVPETLALLNCIVHTNPKLPDEAISHFAAMVKTILEEVEYPPDSRSKLTLLLVACEAIYTRLRLQSLFEVFLQRVRNSFGDAGLAANVQLLRSLIRAARDAGKSKGQRDTFRTVARLLPQVKDEQIRGVYMALLSLVPKTQKSLLINWSKKFQMASPVKAVAFAHEFARAVEQGTFFESPGCHFSFSVKRTMSGNPVIKSPLPILACKTPGDESQE
ncbi:hypothetical protein BZM27_11055 [Paraburkholderia steynii]|uniref:AAA+ ATPase domain-containing protein n=1 Tax=Paraburkholderia steynii TaxID=1245441 RepID=A0A4R0XPU7_9BURK|nr:hypothetical protein BZM27_11055 [Paraburkholderia steynii]